jgi:transcriptional regulator GlxA family with amidase domain
VTSVASIVMPVLQRLGAVPSERRVVFGDRIVTAAGVSAGIDMALALAERIVGRDAAEGIQLMIEYDPQPPLNAGSPRTASGPPRR